MNDMDKTKEQLVEELEQLRKKAAELEDSERKFRVLAESTTAQISVVQGDRYLYGNQALLDYYAIDLEDLELTTVDELTMGMISPEEMMRMGPQYQAAVERGDTHFSVEYQDMEGTWFQTNAVTTELEGKEAFIAMSFDITEHKRAVEALSESEKKFRALAESTTAQILITQENRFVYANKAALDRHGLTWEELAAQTPQDLLLGEDDDPAECEAWAAEQIQEGGGKLRTVHSEPDGSGGERWFETHVARVDIDGEPAFISTSFDITELKRAQNEMYRADKMAALGQIIAGVAHEINNPNNFIYFNLPILRRYIEAMTPLIEVHLDEQPDLKILKMPYEVFVEDVFKLLENMEHGSRRITGIVSDLKNYVRSDEGADRKAEEVGQAIDRVMTLVGKQVRKMVKHLDVDVAPTLPLVSMDVGKIEQVLINLLINAGQAADKEDSWVKLSAKNAPDTPGWVELRVEDNGTGIPQQNLEQIFEPFFTSKGREQGTGLGLSISHRIIEEHGGELSVQSTPGDGSCFTVLLPAAAET